MTNGRKARQQRRDRATYQSPSGAMMDAKLKSSDIPGQHIWIMTAAWKIADPEKAYKAATTREFDPDQSYLLDGENMLGLAGPGCYKCEREYSPKLAALQCQGNADRLM
jgi:hypothetical protein